MMKVHVTWVRATEVELDVPENTSKEALKLVLTEKIKAGQIDWLIDSLKVDL